MRDERMIETSGTEHGAANDDRRFQPRVKATALQFCDRWIRLSTARRIAAIALSAAVLGGATATACDSSAITGPAAIDEETGLVGGSAPSGTLLSTSDDDDDSRYTYHKPEHKRKNQDEANADPDYTTTTETTFPVTEAVYNTCRNEGPIVLNGYLRSRVRIDADPLGSLRFQLREYKDTRGVYGDYTYDEDYYDDHDNSWKKRTHVVRYHNREFLLDQFKVGPAEAPFRSEFISKMHLQREGHDHRDDEMPTGDDLYVFVKQIMKIDTNGQLVVQHKFETDCK